MEPSVKRPIKEKPPMREMPLSAFYKYPNGFRDIDAALESVHQKYLGEYKVNDYNFADKNCRIGIEVEVENVRSYDEDSMYCWQYHEDSSLRNNGREFVTYPIQDKQIAAALIHLFTKILPKGYDFSKRTSVHVHMNVRNLTSAQVVSIVCLYLCFEKLFYKFIGQERDKNIFCVPLLQTFLGNALMTDMNTAFKAMRWYKYSSINLLPIQSLGTLEFRHMHGTDDIGKIVAWINMLQSLRIYATTHSLETILNEIKTLNTNSQYDYYVTRVFGDFGRPLDRTDLAKDMEECIIAVKQSTLNNQFHKDMSAKIYDESPLAKFLYEQYKKVIAVQLKEEAIELTPVQVEYQRILADAEARHRITNTVQYTLNTPGRR